MKYEKINSIKESPIVGNYYLVPCVINSKTAFEIDKKYESTCTPIYLSKHHDSENGQHYDHYHVDSRFIAKWGEEQETAIIDNLEYVMVNITRFNSKVDELEIKYLVCKCMHTHEYQETPVRFISKSTLNHKCLVNGKCPHRGHDLSNISPINGIISCPLHGLKFNSETKELIPQ